MTEAVIRTRIDSRAEVVAHVHRIAAQTIGHKPVGLWYSVNGDWERWCAEESPGWLESKFTHFVELGDENILTVSGVSQFDEFSQRFGAENPRCTTMPGIDWAAVAEEYDGIEIAPYLWERRNENWCGWYYTWDCASGCVWRPKGIRLNRANKEDK